MERRAVSAMLERRMSDTWTLAAGGGAGLPGFMEIAGERYSIDPGWLVAGASSWRLLEGQGKLPFLLLSVTFGASGASTRREMPRARTEAEAEDSSAYLIAIDARLGLIVGKTFWDVLTPYAAARVFGGPIFWERRGESLGGTDRRHFQLALGMSSSLPAGIDLFAEVAPLGERAVSVGAGRAF